MILWWSYLDLSREKKTCVPAGNTDKRWGNSQTKTFHHLVELIFHLWLCGEIIRVFSGYGTVHKISCHFMWKLFEKVCFKLPIFKQLLFPISFVLRTILSTKSSNSHSETLLRVFQKHRSAHAQIMFWFFFRNIRSMFYSPPMPIWITRVKICFSDK